MFKLHLRNYFYCQLFQYFTLIQVFITMRNDLVAFIFNAVVISNFAIL